MLVRSATVLTSAALVGSFLGAVPAGAVVVDCSASVSGTPTVAGLLNANVSLSNGGTWQSGSPHVGWRIYDGGSNYTQVSEQYAYTPDTSVQGRQLIVYVDGTITGGASKSCKSAVTAPIGVAAAPVVSGKVKKGKTITASVGAVAPGVTVTYQWFRVTKKHKALLAKPIGGATGPSYTLKKADKGKKVRVVVSYKMPNYGSASATSADLKVH